MTSRLEEAAETEDQALSALEVAAKAFKNAQNARRTAQSEASREANELSPNARNRSAQYFLSQDQSSAASEAARAADAQLHCAMIYYDRWSDAQSIAELIRVFDLAGPGLAEDYQNQSRSGPGKRPDDRSAGSRYVVDHPRAGA